MLFRSLSGGGRAREFELEYRVRYEFVDARGRAWGEPGEITIRRDFSFSESQARREARRFVVMRFLAVEGTLEPSRSAPTVS